MQEKIDGSLDEMCQISSDWVLLIQENKSLGSDELTTKDKTKVKTMQTTMQTLLRLFGFDSFMPEEINLSEDNFRPQILKRDERRRTY